MSPRARRNEHVVEDRAVAESDSLVDMAGGVVLLDHVEETAHEQNLPNIRTVLASEYDPRIPEKVDLVLICDTLHQIKDPGGYLKDLTRYLKDSARVAVIDYEKNWPSRFDSGKFTVKQLDGWMRSAGCRRDEVFHFLKDNFFIVYRFHGPSS